ncbi:hypothetical protein N9O82_04580 [Methylophilaceae bacterium]|nr:hypothetical protein [Methylophilaceae bacterium]
MTDLARIYNSKGNIYHAIKKSSIGYNGFGEAYFSEINPGVVKGWKRHSSATMNFIVPVGKIKFVIYDNRLKSFENNIFDEIILGGSNNYRRLTIPPNLWVAFVSISQTTSLLLNVSNEEHDPHEAENIDLKQINYNWDL